MVEPANHHSLGWHLLYAAGMAVTCLVAYWFAMLTLASPFPSPSGTVGAMWAAIAAAFVFRDTDAEALRAGVTRLRATAVSFALCQVYLVVLPPSAIGMTVVVGAGTLIVTVLRWRQDIITTTITTLVIMVLSQLDPQNAWYQPALRFLDTLIGIAVGIACKWLVDAPFLRQQIDE